MKGLVARRNRMLRARHVQHAMATAETVRAQDAARTIENNAQRLQRVRNDLFEATHVTSGSALASYRELAARLEKAGRQLDGALYDARRTVTQKEGERIVANREKEIAARLKDQARRALDEQFENRIASLPQSRRANKMGGHRP